MAKKKLMALALTAAMLSSSMTAFASEATIDWGANGGKTTLEFYNYTVDPALEVLLPGELAFAINPLRLDADDNTATTDDKVQIVSSDYVIRNYSDVDVLITSQTRAKAGDGVTDIQFVTTAPAADTNYDSETGELVSETNKRAVLLAMELPSGAATADADSESGAKLTYTKIAWDGSTGVAAGSGDALKNQYLLGGETATEVLFLLQAPTKTDGSFEKETVSGFSFSGAVDPTKAYAESDVTVETIFTMNAVTQAQNANYEAGSGTLAGSFADSNVVKKVASN